MSITSKSVAEILTSHEPARWVFAGDSITHGALHTMGWRDFVELFSERLRWEMGRGRDCVIKTGVSGWQIDTFANDLEWSLLQHRPHVALLNFGMNDCAAGTNGVPTFKATYQSVVARIRQARPDARIVLQTPNRILPADVQRYPFLYRYVAAIRELAAEHNLLLVDHFEAWELFERDGTMPFLLSDALHPNEIGHRVMVRCLLSALKIWDPTSRTAKLFIS